MLIQGPLVQVQRALLACGLKHCKNITMTSTVASKDHLEVTKEESRNPTIHSSVVTAVSDLSPTVKKLELLVKPSVDGRPFNFLPGQWVDMFVPGIETVGGFSITCSPKEFKESGLLTLAIKYSNWPPTLWAHTQCTKGSQVAIRSGGEFTLAEKSTGGHVFVAGGVGVNPIVSMIAHLSDIEYSSKITLLFTAKSVDELIFKDRFDHIASKLSNFQPRYFITGSSLPSQSASDFTQRRISQDDILAHLTPDTLLYVCGPPQLIEMCERLGSKCKQIHYEKWWK